MTSKRPNRTSMEGMIWNAHHVLDAAMSRRYNGVPKAFFQTAVGIVLISIVEVGFIFSGNVGTGIILHKRADGSWSAPSACGMTGLGFGFMIGASVKDLIIFVFEESTLKGLSANMDMKLGTQSELTVGPLGRTYQFDSHVSAKNFGPTVAVAMSKGAFLGLSAEGAVLAVRDKVNKKFYGRDDITPEEILFGNVTMPEGKVTLIDEVHGKLDKLAQGIMAEEDDKKDTKEEEKVSAALQEADKAGTEATEDPDVIEVDAEAEAAKEAK